MQEKFFGPIQYTYLFKSLNNQNKFYDLKIQTMTFLTLSKMNMGIFKGALVLMSTFFLSQFRLDLGINF